MHKYRLWKIKLNWSLNFKSCWYLSLVLGLEENQIQSRFETFILRRTGSVPLDFFNIICFTWIENSCIGYPQSPSLQLNIHFRHFWVLLNLLLFPLLDISLPDTIESSLIKSRAKVVISRLLIRHSDWLNFLHFDGYRLRLNSSWDSSKGKFKQWSKYSQL